MAVSVPCMYFACLVCLNFRSHHRSSITLSALLTERFLGTALQWWAMSSRQPACVGKPLIRVRWVARGVSPHSRSSLACSDPSCGTTEGMSGRKKALVFANGALSVTSGFHMKSTTTKQSTTQRRLGTSVRSHIKWLWQVPCTTTTCYLTGCVVGITCSEVRHYCDLMSRLGPRITT
jgi:hypothetical protein